MKHLIRNRTTKRYFAHGDWTPDIAQAQDFGNSLSAISYSIQHGLEKAEMVLVLGDEPSTNDVRFPILEQQTERL